MGRIFSSPVRITFGRAKRFQAFRKNFFLRSWPRTRRSPFPSGGRRRQPSHARRLSDEGERTASASPLIRRSPSSPASRELPPLGEAQARRSTGDGSLCSVSSLRTQRTELCVLRGTHRTVPRVPCVAVDLALSLITRFAGASPRWGKHRHGETSVCVAGAGLAPPLCRTWAQLGGRGKPLPYGDGGNGSPRRTPSVSGGRYTPLPPPPEGEAKRTGGAGTRLR